MYEYVTTLRTTTPGREYHMTFKKTYDHLPKVHDQIETRLLQHDFIWADEEFMVRSSDVTAFHVKRLPTLREKHDEAEAYVLAYLERYHPYDNIELDHLLNIYKHKPTGELKEEIPVCKAVLNLQSFLKPISEYREEQQND